MSNDFTIAVVGANKNAFNGIGVFIEATFEEHKAVSTMTPLGIAPSGAASVS